MTIFVVRRSRPGSEAILTRPLNDIWYPVLYDNAAPQNVVNYQSLSFPFGLDLANGATFGGALTADDFGQYSSTAFEGSFTSFRPRTGGMFGIEWWLVAPAGSESGDQPMDNTFYFSVGIRNPSAVEYLDGVPVGRAENRFSVDGERIFKIEDGYGFNNNTIMDSGGPTATSAVMRIETGQEIYFDGLYSGAFRVITHPSPVTPPTLVFVGPPILKGYFHMAITKLSD